MNLTQVILPLLLGAYLEKTGYTFVFILLSIISFSSLVWINKMACPIDVEHNLK